MTRHTFTAEDVARSHAVYRSRLDEAFWANTDRSGDCWVWLGRRQNPSHGHGGGYGVLDRHGRVLFAHRVAYQRAVGSIPRGLVVMHCCDNPPCIRPDHLRLGTPGDNVRDMAAKGRSDRGEARSRLRTADVIAIRLSPLSQRAVARAFGIDQSTVSNIRRRITWRHVA